MSSILFAWRKLVITTGLSFLIVVLVIFFLGLTMEERVSFVRKIRSIFIQK